MARRKPVTVTINADELRTGDYVHRRGPVGMVAIKDVVVAWIKDDPTIMPLDERLVVHLEDYGDTS